MEGESPESTMTISVNHGGSARRKYHMVLFANIISLIHLVLHLSVPFTLTLFHFLFWLA